MMPRAKICLLGCEKHLIAGTPFNAMELRITCAAFCIVKRFLHHLNNIIAVTLEHFGLTAVIFGCCPARRRKRSPRRHH